LWRLEVEVGAAGDRADDLLELFLVERDHREQQHEAGQQAAHEVRETHQPWRLQAFFGRRDGLRLERLERCDTHCACSPALEGSGSIAGASATAMPMALGSQAAMPIENCLSGAFSAASAAPIATARSRNALLGSVAHSRISICGVRRCGMPESEFTTSRSTVGKIGAMVVPSATNANSTGSHRT